MRRRNTITLKGKKEKRKRVSKQGAKAKQDIDSRLIRKLTEDNIKKKEKYIYT